MSCTVITNDVVSTHDPSNPVQILNLSHCVKLTPQNYTAWNFQLTKFFFGLSLLGYLNRSEKPPAQTVIVDDKTESPNPAYLSWLKQDSMILAALMGTISSNLQYLIVRAQTSIEAWDILAHTYANPSCPHILTLKEKFDSIVKLADQSITDYMHQIKGCVDQLALIAIKLVVKALKDLGYNIFWVKDFTHKSELVDTCLDLMHVVGDGLIEKFDHRFKFFFECKNMWARWVRIGVGKSVPRFLEVCKRTIKYCKSDEIAPIRAARILESCFNHEA